jgi:hypothetical protein
LANTGNCHKVFLFHITIDEQFPEFFITDSHLHLTSIITVFQMFLYYYSTKTLHLQWFVGFCHNNINRYKTIEKTFLYRLFEAAKDSEDKLIELTVNYVNENFVVINIVNSCSSKPLKVNGELKSTKEHKGIHGYGLKIIKRIAKENGGSVNYNFDENKMRFTISVVLNTISLYHWITIKMLCYTKVAQHFYCGLYYVSIFVSEKNGTGCIWRIHFQFFLQLHILSWALQY